MESRTASSAAVREVLNVDNYLVWSVQVKTYLIAQDLWDVVEDDKAAFKDGSKKNAMALHVIQISCPQRICHVISLITFAKIAWETLELICSIPKSDYVVPEEVEESYVAWSNWMKTILMSHDLWNIIETTTEPTTHDWSKKNALALYLIRESCTSDIFSLIEKISKAENAWKEIEFNSGSNMIVLDDVDKYKDWILQVKTKLKHLELWDIVEGNDVPPKAENDDAKALEVIKDSCEYDFRRAIEKISSAKIAWDTLAGICTLPKTAFESLEGDGNNYLDWSLKVKAIFMDRQLWDIVEGTDDSPKSKKNIMALALIKYSCSWFPNSSYILGSDKLESITSAKIVWDTLAAICALPKNIHKKKESIAAFFERLDSIPAVIKCLDDVDNYKDWSLQVKTYLTDQQLWDIVEGTNEHPKAENDEVAFKAWLEKNALAFRVIVFLCGYRLRFAIWWITSAKIAWDTLAEICKFPKIKYIVPGEYNYVAWSGWMKDYLKDYYLWDIVAAATEPPKPENDEIAFNAWSKKNAKALYLIWESSKAFYTFKKSTRTARIAWDTLGGYHNSRGNMIVLDDVDKYEDWILQVKTELRDKQLWDIVEGTDEPPKADIYYYESTTWPRKNAEALKVIKRSSTNEFYDAIRRISLAKLAWDTLEAICALPETAFEFLAQDGNNYLDWSLKVKAILTNRQLWDIVEGTDDPPNVEKNGMALGLIEYSCFGFRAGLNVMLELDDKLESITSAKIVWDALAAICALPKSNSHIDILEDKKSIAAVVERLESIPAVIKRLDDVDNYKDWSDQVKTYLTNKQRLWDIVEGNKAENDEAWSEKNAMALAVIVFSCGYRLRFAIWWITSAKIVWDTLAAICEFPKSSYIVPKEYDYVAWSVWMEDYLKQQKLWDIVEAATEPPKPKDDENTFNAWSKKNAKALYLIWESSDAYSKFQKSTRTAQIAWDTLEEFGNPGDWAREVLEEFPNLVTALDIKNESPMLALASLSFAYTSGNQLIFWKQWIYKSQGSVWNLLKFLEIDEINELKRHHDKSIKKLLHHMCEVLAGLNFQQLENGKVIEAIAIAVKQGRVEFVTEILKAFPELAWHVEKSKGRNIFMLAVLYRQDEVFRFLCKSPAKYSILAEVDFDSNSILHIAAMLEPSARPIKAPGAALLMQREVQWFKAVERIVHPSTLERTNKKDQTPRQLLIESHKDLMKEGEKWMKEIANSCTAVDILIVTIMFAAAITVPGGNKQESGLPMFLNVKVFMLFIISDALSLLFASISLLMFLGFTSSSYKAEDFLQSLPKKMMIGISTLIISIATMMITFCASLFIILKGKSSVIIPIICLASVPVALFAWMQLCLLIDMINLTYGSRILGRKAKYGA